MIGKIIALPFVIIKNAFGALFWLLRSLFGVIFAVLKFLFGHILGTVFGAIIGFLLGRKHIGVKLFTGKKKKKKD
jgi:hypothetical protein